MPSKSLAELRASSATALPEWVVPVCLAQKLVGEVMALEQEKVELEIEASRQPDEDGNASSGPPRRAGEGPDHPRIAEIDSRLQELWDEMREHTGDLRLRGIDAGEWTRWRDAHPPREDNKIDEVVTYGFCDSSALLADLGRYAVSYNGTDLAEGDWEFISKRAAPGDLKKACTMVVEMHEGRGIQAPKGSRKVSSTSPPSEIATPSPATSESATSDS